ncbi:alpha/beta hydrolase [Hwangdonia lutea]|uniref:Alpha/beta hydrolase n=1 Tax=Hwangdonia lutea TaxID=3075823 RepID=A0AA97EP26_9FLAO|nr:alpha/beta hydrolase [Hwangdonia sp. SCSIO 19198]WOD45189.1 alpha/beta hydrolase [Hwangdonia sp. SCSIO 19198]
MLLFSIISFLWSQNKITYTYAIKGTDTLKLDVHSPENVKPNDSLPVLLWMHGGGFSGGTRDNKHHEQKLAEYVTTKGYIGISISYRLLRKGTETGFGCDCPKTDKLETFKQAAIDYLDAAKFILDNKKKLQVDSSKIIAGGSSAGAEGILNAVYMKSFFVDELEDYKDVNFAGVFSLAGAMVNAEYISKHNALPTVLFHGTDDNLVPFGSAPHHYCTPEKPGYLLLDGSEAIAQKLDDLGVSYYFHKVIGGRHELSSIPFDELDAVFEFFGKTVLQDEIIQTKKIITKKSNQN